MRVTVTEAKGQLTELVRRAEAGEEVVLTRHGHSVAKIVAVVVKPDRLFVRVGPVSVLGRRQPGLERSAKIIVDAGIVGCVATPSKTGKRFLRRL
jgi:prevent-host-death family protein